MNLMFGWPRRPCQAAARAWDVAAAASIAIYV